MDFSTVIEQRMAEIACACTGCGKCFEACPMTVPAGLQGQDPGQVVAGILDLLCGGEGNAQASRWASACSMSGLCIPACPDAVNPRTMVRLAAFADKRRRLGKSVTPNALKAWRAMAHAVRVVSRLQLGADEIARLQRSEPAQPWPAAPPDVVLYTGCNVHKTPHILVLCLEILGALGLTYEVIGGPAACCGIIQFTGGDASSAGRAGLSTLDKIEAVGAAHKLSWCPSCQAQFDDIIIPAHERISNRLDFALTPFFVFLAGHLDALAARMTRPVNKRVALNERPGYPEVTRAVKAILAAVPGVEFVDLDVPRAGLMSNYLTVAPRFKSDLRESEFRAAAEAGATTLATVYHACHRELCHYEKEVSFEIINVVEIIGESLGITADDIYKRLKMMDSVEEMLRECAGLIAANGLDVDEAREILLADQLAAQAIQGESLDERGLVY